VSCIYLQALMKLCQMLTLGEHVKKALRLDHTHFSFHVPGSRQDSNIPKNVNKLESAEP